MPTPRCDVLGGSMWTSGSCRRVARDKYDVGLDVVILSYPRALLAFPDLSSRYESLGLERLGDHPTKTWLRACSTKVAMTESLQPRIYTSLITILVPALLLVCLRFYARRLKRVKLWWDDYLAVLSLVYGHDRLRCNLFSLRGISMLAVAFYVLILYVPKSTILPRNSRHIVWQGFSCAYWNARAVVADTWLAR
ncbi:hypothetical protein VFPPC_12360 [Pochonia chlamydosporia 170]|uniref:Uncharacterized protein n=1 Tax=Pochonia chlamydosporia 170 TaxID=1380566 RepID=A0A179EWK8_METCM|nr:hypothetical protein VFPPC_12360 [Pochonia chlamydosporia 170]OAQ57564.1 hypothetical protein VFPPC_12360 [Pochonia chlamydosporia 170]